MDISNPFKKTLTIPNAFVLDYLKIVNLTCTIPKNNECEGCKKSSTLFICAKQSYLKNRYLTRTSMIELKMLCKKCVLDHMQYKWILLHKSDWGYFIKNKETMLRLFRKRDTLWKKLSKDVFNLILEHLLVVEFEYLHNLYCVGSKCDYYSSIDECENDGDDYIPRCPFIDSWIDLSSTEPVSKKLWESQFC